MLPGVLDDLKGLSGDEAKHYTKGEDGKYYLDAGGMVLKAKVEGKLEEGNKKRAEMSAEIEKLKEQLGGSISKAEHKKLQDILDDLENGRGGEKFKSYVEKETAKFKSQYEEQLKAAKEEGLKYKSEAEKAQQGLKSYRIRQEVAQEALTAGLSKKGLNRYLDLVEKEFDLIKDANGNEKIVPVRRNADGTTTPLIGDDFGEQKVSAYIAKAHKTGDLEMFFAQPSGGGAQGNNEGAKGSQSSGGGSLIISRSDAKDTQRYQAAKQEAAKQGKELSIAPE